MIENRVSMALTGLMYPDVLRRITPSAVNAGALQYAVGVMPRAVRLNQSLDVVLILQNTVPQNMTVRVGIRSTERDAHAAPVTVRAEKETITIGMGPGEVGVLRAPLMPIEPTPPNQDYPVTVAVRYRLPSPPTAYVRPPYPGVAPAQLNISPYKLSRLRKEVIYERIRWHQSTEVMTVHFSLMDSIMPPISLPATPYYETIWSSAEMTAEHERAEAARPAIGEMLDLLDMEVLTEALITGLHEAFRSRQASLLPAEATLVAGLMLHCVHTADPNARWYAALAQALGHYPGRTTAGASVYAEPWLLEPLLWDAVQKARTLTARRMPSLLNTRSTLLEPDAVQPPDVWDIYIPLIFGALLLDRSDMPTQRASLHSDMRAAIAQRRLTAEVTGNRALDAVASLLKKKRH
ncbi:MAG: hypothetical protein AAF125_20860 [Chloroflexota bacterium]